MSEVSEGREASYVKREASHVGELQARGLRREMHTSNFQPQASTYDRFTLHEIHCLVSVTFQLQSCDAARRVAVARRSAA
jgi:hypothetical protein